MEVFGEKPDVTRKLTSFHVKQREKTWCEKKNSGLSPTSYAKRHSDSVCEVEIIGWRRAEHTDIDEISKLMKSTPDSTLLFHDNFHILQLIEKSFFPIVQLDTSGQIMSFIAYNCYPNIPSVPRCCWAEWIQELYKVDDADSRNSLFIHYMVWRPSESSEFLRLLLETPFLEFVHLRYVFFVKPPFADILLPYDFRNHGSGAYSLQSIHICPRHTMVERLCIRKALAEDNDSLMSILRSDGNNLEEMYGEFFFAELTDFPGSPDRRIIVCEFEGDAVGAMSVNLGVDLEFMNEEFELLPFHGLRKVDENDLLFDMSMSSIGFAERERLTLDMLRSEEFEILKMYTLTLGASIVELKRNESQDSSDLSSDYGLSLIHISSTFDDLSSKSSSVDLNRMESVMECKPSFLSEGLDNYSLDEIEAHRNRNRLSLAAMQRLFIPRYNGPSNAFAIEFFAIDNDKIDERLSIQFVEAAFELAPDRDYCLITIPTHLLPIPLLNHFVRAERRPTKQLRHELYICHRNSLMFTSVYVRRALPTDSQEIKSFLQRVYNSNVIYDEFESSFAYETTFLSFTLMVDRKIVGVALLGCESGVVNLPLYFDVSDYSLWDFENVEKQTVLRHFLLHPQHQNYARYFLMDIMRLADVTSLFHIYYDDSKTDVSLFSVLGQLVPLKPRRKIVKSVNYPSPKKSNSEFINFEKAFSLFYTNLQICSRTKLSMNKIIVVVGASITAVSFFEHILFGSSNTHICYSNLIWISPHGTGQEVPSSEIRDLMFPITNKYDRKYLLMLSLKTHVQFIYGFMTGINRKNKYVIVDNKSKVNYDILVLTVGLQFSIPTPEIKKKMRKCEKTYPRSSLSRFLTFENESSKQEKTVKPINMFIINTFLDANNAIVAFQFLQSKLSMKTMEKKIIVYGHNIRVFLVLQSLLKLGIPGEMIVFVEPFPSHDNSITIFGDTSIDQAVINSIKSCNIQYYREYFFYDWVLVEQNRISTITFNSSNKQITLHCLAFIPMVQKLVSEVNFNACTEAGLVYDGKLVIDCKFKTSDENIFAAGSFTKYGNRYYAPEQAHQYFNSTEIGEKLAKFFRCEIDPCENEEATDANYDKDSNFSTELPPVLKEPIMVYCQLPGDFYYLLVRKPGKPIDYETALSQGDFGDVLSTGDCQMSEGRGYFQLHLDSTGCVQSIMCFTQNEIDYENLYSLYGLNEKLLNNLLMRYDRSMITDFFEYFKEPWAQAIYHTKFPFLSRWNVKKLAEAKFSDEQEMFVNRLIEAFQKNNWKQLPEEVRKNFEQEFEKSPIKQEIINDLMDFLNYYDRDLPTYDVKGFLTTLRMESFEQKERKEHGVK